MLFLFKKSINMEKSEIMKLKAQFDNYKAEYSNIETKEERKKE